MRTVREVSKPVYGYDSRLVRPDGRGWEGIAYEARAVVEYEGDSKVDSYVEGELGGLDQSSIFAKFKPEERIDCQLLLWDSKGRVQYDGPARVWLPLGGNGLRFMGGGERGALVNWCKRRPEKYRLRIDYSE